MRKVRTSILAAVVVPMVLFIGLAGYSLRQKIDENAHTSYRVQGLVLDMASRLPISGIHYIDTSGRISGATDFQGKFEFSWSDNLKMPLDPLITFSGDRYRTMERIYLGSTNGVDTVWLSRVQSAPLK